MVDNPEKISSHYNQQVEKYNKIYFGDSDDCSAPIVAKDIVAKRLENKSVNRVLDMGCGNGGILISLLEKGFDAYGFDIAPDLIEQAKIKIEDHGYEQDRVTQANMEEDIPFEGTFDAIIGLGIFPQLSDIDGALQSVSSFVDDDGIILIQFRNKLMSVYSLNEYSYQFYMQDLYHDIDIPDEVEQRLREAFRMDEKMSGRSPHEDPEGAFHNPLTIDKFFTKHGFNVNDKHFYHYHGFPPEFENTHPDRFKKSSSSMENPSDWRGYIMASSFIVEAEPTKYC